MLEPMAGSRDDDDRTGDAFKRAFGDVQPLRSRSPRRVARSHEPKSAETRRGGAAATGTVETLFVERESNGIITGRRPSTHSSIVDALEDPRLEVEAELDLHGLTTKEAERDVLRFLRTEQSRGRRWVCIVVGKGLHSPRGKGTLKDHVVEALSRRAPARFVLAFRTAPRRLGGRGALVARLVDRA
jgi:DNA-nicking Smr family endonuclease